MDSNSAFGYRITNVQSMALVDGHDVYPVTAGPHTFKLWARGLGSFIFGSAKLTLIYVPAAVGTVIV